MKVLTRLLSNLRPTTREYVHLVTRGDHTMILHNRKPCCICNLHGFLFYRTTVSPIEVSHCGNRHFRPLLLTWPWPWPNDLHTGCANTNFLRQGYRKLSSERQTDRRTDRPTDTTEIIHHVASRVVKY